VSDELADILPLRPEFTVEDEQAPLRSKERERYCPHDHVTVDSEAHRLTCRACDREVDSIAFLERLAGDWERYRQARDAAAGQARTARQRLEETQRLERNARARLKRLEAKPELAPVRQAEGMAGALRLLVDHPHAPRGVKLYARRALKESGVPLTGDVVDFGEELEA
jgi:hypothetical protein